MAPSGSSRRSSARVPPAPTPSPRKSRSLRPRVSLSSYADASDDDDDAEASDDAASYTDGDGDDDDNDDDDDESAPSASQPDSPQLERGAGGRHSLRPRASLGVPEGLRDYVNTDSALSNKKRKTAGKKKKVVGKRLSPGKACAACRNARRKCDRKKPKCSGCVKAGQKCYVKVGDDDEEEDEEAMLTLRGEIRKGMEETVRKRERFLVTYGGLFEALLPEGNYIQKLRGKFAPDAPITGEEDAPENAPPEAVPYKLLEKQPPG